MGRKRYFIQEAAWEGLEELWEQETTLKSVLEAAAGSRECSSLFSCVKITENPQVLLHIPPAVRAFCDWFLWDHQLGFVRLCGERVKVSSWHAGGTLTLQGFLQKELPPLLCSLGK